MEQRILSAHKRNRGKTEESNFNNFPRNIWSL